MKNIPLLIAALFVAGCGAKEETGEGAKPALSAEGKTIDQQIADAENDKTIPPDYKATYIKSLRDRATAGGGGAAPTK